MANNHVDHAVELRKHGGDSRFGPHLSGVNTDKRFRDWVPATRDAMTASVGCG
jgi:hypothetical protein